MNRVDRLLQNWRIREVDPWIPDGARVLDVGCFDDSLFNHLGRRLGSGIGLDPLLSRAVDGERFTLVPARFPDDPIDGALFDVITMLAVLEHVPEADLDRWAGACQRLLVPGGVVVATVPSPAVDVILAVLVRLRVVHGMSLEEHHGFDPDTAPRIFGRAGLSLAHRQRFQLGLNNLFVFRKGLAEPPVTR